VYTHSTRWSPFGFQRRSDFVGTTAAGQVQSEVRIPLADRGVLFSVEVSLNSTRGVGDFDGGDGDGGGGRSIDDVDVGGSVVKLEIELWPQMREFPSAEINCSEVQWRYPSNMQRNCWNWYAPRSFANESDSFATTYDAARNLLIVRDSVSGAVSAVVPSRGGVLTSKTTMEWSVSTGANQHPLHSVVRFT